MILTLKPDFEIRQLIGPAEVGRFVHINGGFAIVTVAPQDPAKRLMLAQFDPASKSFVHRQYAGEDALIFANELIFEPEISAPIKQTNPGPQSGVTAFTDGIEIYVVLTIGGGADWRLVPLRTGEIVAWNNSPMHTFTRWKLGAGSANGQITWLFQA